MIEVAVTYDLLPDIDKKAYLDLLKKAIVPVLSQSGIVEIGLDAVCPGLRMCW